jgi:hypothetical protein
LFGAGGGSGTTLYGGLNGTTATFSGVIYADDDTTANTPVISFTGDTNTGIGRSAADTIDLITGGISRAKISSIGLQSSVVPDLSGSNTTLFPEYKCRAWISFNGSALTTYGSGNVLSYNRNATGDFTITFNTNMPDINYSIVFNCGNPITLMAINRVMATGAAQAPTTSTFRINSVDTSGVPYNPTYINIAVFR